MQVIQCKLPNFLLAWIYEVSMEQALKNLGKRIAEIRNKRNMTQDKLAELTNYSTNHIAKLESARTNPSFALLVSIANALDVELKELFNFPEQHTTDYIRNKLTKEINKTDNETLKNLYDFYTMLKNYIL